MNSVLTPGAAPRRGPDPRPPRPGPRRWRYEPPARAWWCPQRAGAAWGCRTGWNTRRRAPHPRSRSSGRDPGHVLLGLRFELALARRAAEVVVPASIFGYVPGGRHLDG